MSTTCGHGRRCGVTLGAVNTVGGLVTGFDPCRRSEGHRAMVEGLGKMALTFNPMTAPAGKLRWTPRAHLDMVKNVTHFDDTFTSNGLHRNWRIVSISARPSFQAERGQRPVPAWPRERPRVRRWGRPSGLRASSVKLPRQQRVYGPDPRRRGYYQQARRSRSALAWAAANHRPVAWPAAEPEPEFRRPVGEPVPSSAPTGGSVSAPPDAGLPPAWTHTAPAPEAEVPPPAGSDVTAPVSAVTDGPPCSERPSVGSCRRSRRKYPELIIPVVAARRRQPARRRCRRGHNGGPPHNGDTHGGGPGGQQPNNPPHTGLYDPPANHGSIPGEHLPDLAEIDNEFRLPNGAIDPRRMVEWATRVAEGIR